MARPRTDIQPRILHAARARFLHDGVDGASLRDIARDAKTSIGMVSYYFPTKDDLFLAVVEEIYAGFTADLERNLSAKKPLRERLRTTFVRLGAASPEELDVLRLVIREALVSSKRMESILHRSERGHLMALIKALADGVADGELDGSLPLPVLLISTFALGALPQLLRRARLPFVFPDSEALAELSLDLILRAVGATKSSPARRDKAARRRG
jgi:AcrR family transcriptional regulator